MPDGNRTDDRRPRPAPTGGSHNASWRPDEDARLAQLVDAGLDDAAIAARLGRTAEATTQRRKNLRLLRAVPTCFDWPVSALAMLRDLYAGGHSAAAIADEINLAHPGANLTRSAVLGKAWRRGLSGATASSVTRKARQAASAAGPAPAGTASAASSDGLLGLLELRPTTCRWPHGHPDEPGFGFCGARCPAAAPYCAHHASIAHQPAARPAPAAAPDFPHEARASSGRDRAVAR